MSLNYRLRRSTLQAYLPHSERDLQKWIQNYSNNISALICYQAQIAISQFDTISNSFHELFDNFENSQKWHRVGGFKGCQSVKIVFRLESVKYQSSSPQPSEVLLKTAFVSEFAYLRFHQSHRVQKKYVFRFCAHHYTVKDKIMFQTILRSK